MTRRFNNRAVHDAVKLYKDFTGMDPDTMEQVEIPEYEAAICVGTVDGIMYTTERDENVESYIHEFKEHARPLLCVTHDGQAIVILGGGFTFTDAGFEDDKPVT